MIVGEAPGFEEERKGIPFAGAAGDELSRMLLEAGINRSTCFLTNVIRVRAPGGDPAAFFSQSQSAVTPSHSQLRNKMVLPPVFEGLELLKREIELCQPHVIIALGNVALWALTGKWGIMSWRGSMLQTDLRLNLPYQPKVLATYNPAMVLRQWSWRPITVTDFRRAEGMAKSREHIVPDYKFIIRPSYSTAMSYLNKLLHLTRLTPTKLSVDIETRAGHIACIGISWSPTEAICIPLMCVERPEGYWPLEQEIQIQRTMQELLTHPNAQVVGQNFSYDSQYFSRHLCYDPNLTRDTMLAQHACFSNLQKSLDFLSSMYCTYHAYWKDEGKEWHSSIPEDEYWTYNCKDAVVTYEVDTVLQSNVDKMRVREPHDFQQALYWPVLRTMQKGIRVDKARRAKFASELFQEISEREQYILDVVGRPLNIKSPKQMTEFFYDELKFKPITNRKTGSVTCNEEALSKIATKEPAIRPLVNKILELRSLGVFLSTFISAPLDIDGRMRCSYNIAGTDTYRFASRQNAFGSGLNLQNIPNGGEAGDGLELPNVRTLFIPDEGYEFFDIDLGSADLRIVVWESDEGEMKQMLAEGLDPYTEIAKEFYRDTTISKKDPRRQTFKSFAHGTHYLGTAKGLAERLGLSVRDAESTQKWYFQRFPKIRAWQLDLIDQVTKRRMVQNIFGYRMYFFDRVEGTVLNQAAAWIPQSTVGCLINRAYMNIHHAEPEVDILLQVHDSLAGQYPISKRDTLLPKILKHAEIVLPYKDPLIIPVGVKTSTKSWGDCA